MIKLLAHLLVELQIYVLKDSYRRFIQMYSNSLGVPNYNFEELIENYKLTKGVYGYR